MWPYILAEDQKSVELTEEEFDSYKLMGYFDGITYDWSMFDGVYTVFMTPESYQEFLQNKEGNLELNWSKLLE